MTQRQIAIVGGGFAGVWAGIGAAALLHRHDQRNAVEITVVSPDDTLVVRPRLYEADLGGVRVPLRGVLTPLGVRHLRASVTAIDPERRTLTVDGARPREVRYDQLVMCAGSRVQVPDGAYCADSYEQAVQLHGAIASMAQRRDAPMTATVVGAGFTGLEVAAELAGMLPAAARAAGRPPSEVRVRLVDQGPSIAPRFGPRARTVIEQALRSLGVEVQTGMRVSGLTADGGFIQERGIDDGLLVWAGGPRASSINGYLGVGLDALGRVPVDAHLASEIDRVWAAGDSARVLVDGSHLALMSCQHAMPQGRQAGANAAATMLGRPLGHYRQPLYLTCLDLGSAGAVLTSGFDQDTVLATGSDAKRFKRFINRSLIYPPPDASIEQALTLGRASPPGPLSATLQRLALRSRVLRGAVSARGEDHAARYRANEISQ